MKKINKNNSFKIPESYFENFTDKLIGRLSEEQSNSANPLEMEDGFMVPEGYFEGLNRKINTTIHQQETKVVQLHPHRRYYWVAASIAAILIFIFGYERNAADEITFDSLASSDIESYFEKNDLDLTAMEIAEVFPVDDLAIGDILTNQLSEENVMDYLNNNTESFEEFNLDSDE